MPLIKAKDVVKAVKLDKLGGESTARALMSLFQFDKVNEIYANHRDKSTPEFLEGVLSEAGIQYEISAEDLAQIPREGSFILIANHPYGGVEGLILLNALLSIRPEVKVMANFLFNWIEPLKDLVFGVNPFESHQEAKSSFQGLKQALHHVRQGHPLIIFPAGEVSTFQKNSPGITDKQWTPSIIRFIKEAGVPVVPVYFHGNNSWLFHLIGKIHPMLRTAKIPSEMFNKRDEMIRIRIGKPIPLKEQSAFVDVPQYGRYLRAKVYALENTMPVDDFFKPSRKRPSKAEAIMEPASPYLLTRDIANITPHFQLFQTRNYTVYCAPSAEIPHITIELGRLREITFREVGEGTNRSVDIDEFDLYYHQLFIWDHNLNRIVGGYRIGKGNDIISDYGIKGLYIRTLFKIDKKMHQTLCESIELGRSFIVKDYQRKPMSLFLLWKGILFFLMKNPEYRYLIGPVSISNAYSKLTQQVIVDFVVKHHFDQALGKYIKPRKPFTPPKTKVDTAILTEKVSSFQSLDEIVNYLEVTNMKAPILLKKYLLLGGKIISFNIDPDFNNALDGLLFLDFYNIDSKVIKSLFEGFGEQSDLQADENID
jgi:putative hemolysin